MRGHEGPRGASAAMRGQLLWDVFGAGLSPPSALGSPPLSQSHSGRNRAVFPFPFSFPHTSLGQGR